MSITAPVALDPRETGIFQEAVVWFRQQAPWVSGSSWETMAGLAALKGDQVSGVTLLAVLDDIWKEMDRAVAEGLPYSAFVRSVAEHLRTRWSAADSARLRLIYHNSVSGALMAGRYAQLTDPGVLHDRPYWLFDGIADWRQSPVCRARDGIRLPAEDPWWQSNVPLLHHGCRSGIISLDETDLRELGGVSRPDTLEGMPAVPEGWGSPSSWTDWRPSPESYHPPLLEEYERWTRGEAYIRTKREWDERWRAFARSLVEDSPAG